MNNWLLYVVCGIIIVGVVVGFARGAVRIAVSLVATLLTMAVVFFVTPYVSSAIISMTPIDEMIGEQCLKTMANAVMGDGTEENGPTEEQVRSMLSGAGVSEEVLAAAGITVEDIVNGEVSGGDLEKLGISSSVLDGHTTEKVEESILGAEIPRQTQIEVIEKTKMPELFKDLLLSNNNTEIYKALGVTSFAEYVSSYLAKLIIDLLSFLGTFIIVTVIVRAVVFALDFVAELPVLGTLNRLSGMVLGGTISVIIVWVIFVVITLLYATSVGEMLMEMIEQSKVLSFLYDYNYIMKIATVFR